MAPSERSGRRLWCLTAGMALAFVLVVVLLLPALAPAAKSTVRPIVSHCSKSGDFCQGVIRKDRRIKFDMTQFPFRGKYQICVKSPGPKKANKPRRTCRKFRWRHKTGGLFRGRVDFARHFPSKKRGVYKVTWRVSGSKVGRTLRFRKG